MALKQPLVLANGQIQQLQAGDTIPGGSAPFSASNIVSSDTTMAASESAFRSDFLEISAGIALTVAAEAVMEIG